MAKTPKHSNSLTDEALRHFCLRNHACQSTVKMSLPHQSQFLDTPWFNYCILYFRYGLLLVDKIHQAMQPTCLTRKSRWTDLVALQAMVCQHSDPSLTSIT